jgi:fructosamine-3-kinase
LWILFSEELSMILPAELAETIAAETGQKVVEATSVGGGDISHAARACLADGREVLVKWNAGALSGLFACEGRGLELLRASNSLRIPEVLAYGDGTADRPGFIVMEWLGRGSATPEVAEALGEGLAALHRVTANRYGLDHDNYIGANPQPNRQAENWVTFFREQRLGFQMRLARKKGYLPRQRADRLEKLLARLDDWLPAHPPASLLHGDLWGGNWLTTGSGEPALIDPAVYYGHREAELAFTELFGGFFSNFYRAYNQTWPLDSDYETRKDLYNLYHLLNHLNLFGESYGGGVDSILRRYVG